MQHQDLVTARKLAKMLNIGQSTLTTRRRTKNKYLQIPQPLTIERRQYWKKHTAQILVKNQELYNKMTLTEPNAKTKKINKAIADAQNEKEIVQILKKLGYIYQLEIFRQVTSFINKDGQSFIVNREHKDKQKILEKEKRNITLTKAEMNTRQIRFILPKQRHAIRNILENLNCIKMKIWNKTFTLYKISDVNRVCTLGEKTLEMQVVNTLCEVSEITKVPLEILRSYADLPNFPRPVILSKKMKGDSYWDTGEVLCWLELNDITVSV